MNIIMYSIKRIATIHLIRSRISEFCSFDNLAEDKGRPHHSANAPMARIIMATMLVGRAHLGNGLLQAPNKIY